MAHDNRQSKFTWGRFKSIRRTHNPQGRHVEICLTNGNSLRLSDNEAAFLVFLLPENVPGLCVPPHIIEMTDPLPINGV